MTGGTEAEQRAAAAKLLADQASDPRKALQRAQDRANLPDEDAGRVDRARQYG